MPSSGRSMTGYVSSVSASNASDTSFPPFIVLRGTRRAAFAFTFALMRTHLASHSTAAQNNCDTSVNGNAGCGVKSSASNSYGPAFNSAGGGFYAMERTDAFIKVWFWTRNAGNIPSDVKNGATSVNTDNWVRVVPSSWREQLTRTGIHCDRCRARRLRCSRIRTATSRRKWARRTS